MTSTPPAPTLTGYTDANPCPRVEVVVALAADAATVTITRTAPGVPAATVRGASGAVASGSFLAIDYDVPFGVPVTYTATAFDSNGVPSQSSPTSLAVQLDVAQLWLSDPLNPSSAVAIGATGPAGTVITTAAFTSFNYDLDVQVVPIVGSDLPIGIAGTRRQPSSVPVEFYTDTDDDGTALIDLLRQAFPVCFRVPSGVRFLPALIYAAFSGVTRTPWDVDGGSDLWRCSIDAVKGPGHNLIISPRSLDDLADEASTLAGLGLLYATMLDLQRG